MNVDTALGVLDLPALTVPGAEDCFASAVRFAAKEMSELLRHVPPEVAPSAELLCRSWLGDAQAAAFLRDLEIGSHAALAAWTAWPWTRGVTQQGVYAAHELLADKTRTLRSGLARSRAMADQGACEPLRARTATAWAGRFASRTMTMGQYRRRTGCKCPDPMNCQCMALLPPGGGQ